MLFLIPIGKAPAASAASPLFCPEPGTPLAGPVATLFSDVA
jgi:hypothetical protein